MPPDALSDEIGADPILRIESGGAAVAAQSAFTAASSGSGGEVPYRNEMESSFGRDFGSVRSFTGKAEETRAMGAVAATQRDTVVFSESSPSRETVAHELAHVTQFDQGGVPSTGEAFGRTGSSAEVEADRVSGPASRGQKVSVGAAPSGAIHRRVIPGSNPPRNLPSIVSKETFKEKSAVFASFRGKTLEQVDTWLDAIDKATDPGDFQFAVAQCLDAADAWLAENDDAAKRSSSNSTRWPWVQMLRSALVRLNGARRFEKAESDPTAPDGTAIAGGVMDAYSGSVGLVGAGADIDKDNSFSKINETDSGADASGYKVAAAEGTGQMVGGGVKMFSGISKLVDAKGGVDVAEGGLGALEGGMLMGQGAAKFAGGVQGMKGMSDAATESGKVSDSFGMGASIAGGLSQALDFGKGMAQLADDEKFTGQQWFDFVTARTKNVVAMAKAGADGYNSYIKATTAAAHVGASTASGALGVITGGIDVIHGAGKIGTALSNKSDLDKARKSITTNKANLTQEIARLDQDKAKILRMRVHASIRTRWLAETGQFRSDAQAALTEVNTRGAELLAAADAMEKVQDRRLRDGVFKTVTGSLDVVTGALVLSGVGAPVAIALAAFNGLLKLGSVVLDWGRTAKASTLAEIALRLTDGGQAKGKADPPKSVGYRTMENRVHAAYYRHYYKSITREPPAGLNASEWTDIRDFVLEEKLNRVPEGTTKGLTKAQATSVSVGAGKEKWAKITDAPGVEERPGFFARRALDLTFSAHKSAQSIDASNSELADAVVKIAMGAFDPRTKKFVDGTQVLPHPAPQTKEGAAQQHAMAVTLLGNVGIKDPIWIDMWSQAGGKWIGDDDGGRPLAQPKPPDMSKLAALVKAKIDAT